MKKMMLLVGLLCICGLGYAEEPSNVGQFQAKIEVIKPVGVTVSEKYLDFGTVIAGSKSVMNDSDKSIKVTVTGSKDRNIDISYRVNGKKLDDYAQVELNQAGRDSIVAKLYKGNNKTAFLKDETVMINQDDIQFEINGHIAEVPGDAEGIYASNPIVIRVAYQ